MELLGRCSLKDSRENDQSQINMFRVRGLRVTKLTQHNTPNEKSCSSLPVERGIGADSPSLWNQSYEPLMGVVCSLHILCQEDMENEKQFPEGRAFEGSKTWTSRLVAVETLCPATTTAMHFILQNLLHRDRSDLTKALQDYCTFYLDHFLYPNLDSQPRRRSAALHQNEKE